MNKFFAILLLLLVTVAGGCKLEHNSRVKQSQLLGEIQTVEATVRVEVAACNHYDDKSRPSDSLVRTNNTIKSVFPDSEFEGCKMENMKSMATYITPMEVGTLPPEVEEYQAKGVGIVRNQYGIVYFCLSKDIRAKIAEGRKGAMTKDLALEVRIRFNNDTKKEARIYPYAIFADGEPFAGVPAWGNHIVVKPGESSSLTLSNVAAEYAIVNGIVPVFNEPKDSDR